MNDTQLRSAYRDLILRPGAGRPACPPPEALDALVSRRGSEEARLGTLNHAMTCTECRRELDMLRAIQATGPSPAWRARIVALAATLTLVVGVGVIWQAGREDSPEVFRGEPEAPALLEPGEMARVTVPVRLIWGAVRDASGYRVEVLNFAGAVIASARSADTVVILPADALAPADSAYRWRVMADVRTGESVSSRVRRFVVNAP